MQSPSHTTSLFPMGVSVIFHDSIEPPAKRLFFYLIASIARSISALFPHDPPLFLL